MNETQNLLQGGEEPSSRPATILDIYEHNLGGNATKRQLAAACIEAGVFDSAAEEAIHKLAIQECGKALKQRDAQGLPYAGPVKKDADGQFIWVQRSLWTLDDYIVHDDSLGRQEETVHEMRAKLRDEAKSRFGVNPSWRRDL